MCIRDRPHTCGTVPRPWSCSSSADHVGTEEDRLGHGQTERGRGLEVDGEDDVLRALDGKVLRPRPTKDACDESRRLSTLLAIARAVGDESPVVDPELGAEDRWDASRER